MWLLAILLVFSIYFTPASYIARPDYFIVVLMAVIGFSRSGQQIFRLIKFESKLMMALAVFAIISIAGQVVSGWGFHYRDLMIVVRYVVYLAAICAGVALGLSLENLRLTAILAIVLAIASILISFAQYFNVGDINSIILPIYTFEDRYATLEAGASWRRIIGTMGNPNYWGFFLGMGFVIGCYQCLKKQYLYLCLAAPLLVCIIMTGSRTSLVAAVMSAMFALLLAANTKQRFSVKALVPVVMGAILFGLFYLTLIFFMTNYYESENRFSASNLDTLQLRMRWWGEIWNQMLAQPQTIIVGRGPSTMEGVRFGDNMYIRYLRDFGIIGLGLYIVLLKKILKSLYRLEKSTTDKAEKLLVASALLIFVQLIIFDLAADGWFNVRIAELLLFIYGLALGYSYKQAKKKKFYESVHNNS